ncbi:hypothetical protein ABIB90_007288 [Bradyrhizobium sp. JR4.1]
MTASLPPRDRLKMTRELPGRELIELTSQSSLARRKPVDVQHGLPRRPRFAKLREGGLPPQAARVHGILPEIVQMLAAPADIGDLVGPIVDRGERIAVALERRSAKHPHRSAILPLDEVQRPSAFDLFQP